jgi:N-dimethylarginine dimethylaminohydrolase
LVLAWFAVMESLVAWERAKERYSLRDLFSLPPVEQRAATSDEAEGSGDVGEVREQWTRERVRVAGLQQLRELDAQTITRLEEELHTTRNARDQISRELEALRNTRFWRLVQWFHRVTGA